MKPENVEAMLLTMVAIVSLVCFILIGAFIT